MEFIILLEAFKFFPKSLIKKFGMGFRKALIDDRVSEELRTFCANSSIDEVKQILSGNPVECQTVCV